MKTIHITRGFTLTEIIVVVSIISLLTVVAVGSYGRIKVQSTATAWVQQLAEIETALKTYRQYELPNGWPTVLGNQGSIQSIVSGSNPSFPNFDQYFTGSINLPQDVGFYYSYSGSNFYTCNASVANFESSGVNIYIENAPVEVVNLMNDMIDGDSPTNGCGKVRLNSSGDVFYNISSSTFSY